MEARKRPPRKLFFSAKGTMEARVSFTSEPAWTEDSEKREILKADCIDLDTDQPVVLEQFCPDAYDLSEALVKGLGSTVIGKRAAIMARGATRKTNDGKTVQYLDGFTVTPLMG